jgi:hypothetical protein
MDESLEADLIAAHRAPFDGGHAAWVDVYVTSASRLQPSAEPARVAAAADRAWRTHSWAHPAIVAHLEQQLGPLTDV